MELGALTVPTPTVGHQQDTNDMVLAGLFDEQIWEGKQEFVLAQPFDARRG